jgi:hypothetical protein
MAVKRTVEATNAIHANLKRWSNFIERLLNCATATLINAATPDALACPYKSRAKGQMLSS